MNEKVSIIIPALNPGDSVHALHGALISQHTPPEEIIVVDSASTDGSADLWEKLGCKVIRIERREFDHGGTRNLGARSASGDILVFMTQDAIPADEDWLGNLVSPIVSGEVQATFARQVARENASDRERFAREFNYPAESRTKSSSDIQRMGIKAFFYSNVCAAVGTRTFREVGAFPERIILNEDVTLCAKMLRAGLQVRYEADARVVHSHDYTLRQQFRRNFDIGVSTREIGSLIGDVDFGGEGMRFVSGQAKYVNDRSGYFAVFGVLVEAAVKLTAFQMGRRHGVLPTSFKRRISMNPPYWMRQST